MTKPGFSRGAVKRIVVFVIAFWIVAAALVVACINIIWWLT